MVARGIYVYTVNCEGLMPAQSLRAHGRRKSMFKKFVTLLVLGAAAACAGFAFQGCASIGDGGYYGPRSSEYHRIGQIEGMEHGMPGDVP